MDTILIALGGNAILKRGEEATFLNQYRNVENAAKSITSLLKKKDMRLVITHGNGPQVGDELLRGEYAADRMPQLPLHILTAETQAFIGSMLESALLNEMGRHSIKIDVSTVLTHILVDRNDGAFKTPSKPIGPHYSKKELEERLSVKEFDYVEHDGYYRQVVPSPMPIEVIELDSIRRLLDGGNVVIAGGGGGVPIARSENGIIGVDAVIDKDATSELLARELHADKMIILTDAEYLYTEYGKESSRVVYMSAAELEGIVGSLQNGTIKPKVEACIRFVNMGGKEAYIGNLFKLDEVLAGKSGTRIRA